MDYVCYFRVLGKENYEGSVSSRVLMAIITVVSWFLSNLLWYFPIVLVGIQIPLGFQLLISDLVSPIFLSVLTTLLTFFFTSQIFWRWEENRERKKLFEKRKLETLEKIHQALDQAFIIYREGDQLFRDKTRRFEYEPVTRNHLKPLLKTIKEIIQTCTMAFDPMSDFLIAVSHLEDDLMALLDQESVIREGTSLFANTVARIIYNAHKLASLASKSLEHMEPVTTIPDSEPIQRQPFRDWYTYLFHTQFGLKLFITDHEIPPQAASGRHPFVGSIIGFVHVDGLPSPIHITLVNATPYQSNYSCKRITRQEFEQLRNQIAQYLTKRIQQST